ncbi:MAG: cytidylate kinase family protein [Thermodesulfobacteriota bacterium]
MNIITISRQVGAYADLIAATVARKMGLEFIDRDRVHQVALSCDPEYGDLCTIYETEHGPGFFERLFFDRPSYTSLFEALTFEQAAQENVVIMGRGAQLVLRDVPGVFRARIVATLDVRVLRIMERHGLSREEAEDFIHKHEHERDRLIRSIFRSDPNDWSLFDIIINTAQYSPANAADVLIEAIKKKEKVPDKEDVREMLRDRAFAKRVETVIRRRLTSAVAGNVVVTAEPGGVIRLSGRIAEEKDKNKAAKVALGFPGVTRVENDVKVTEITF